MSGPLLGPEGSPIIAGEASDDPNDDSERCEVCGGLLAIDACKPTYCVAGGADTEPAPAPPVVVGPRGTVVLPDGQRVNLSHVVATPDGVFVGEALAAHQRTTQAPRPARVTSVAGRVEREIRLLGALSAIIAAYDADGRGRYVDRERVLREVIERARALLVEGGGQ